MEGQLAHIFADQPKYDDYSSSGASSDEGDKCPDQIVIANTAAVHKEGVKRDVKRHQELVVEALNAQQIVYEDN